jgi:hypothetical protein
MWSGKLPGFMYSNAQHLGIRQPNNISDTSEKLPEAGYCRTYVNVRCCMQGRRYREENSKKQLCGLLGKAETPVTSDCT